MHTIHEVAVKCFCQKLVGVQSSPDCTHIPSFWSLLNCLKLYTTTAYLNILAVVLLYVKRLSYLSLYLAVTLLALFKPFEFKTFTFKTLHTCYVASRQRKRDRYSSRDKWSRTFNKKPYCSIVFVLQYFNSIGCCIRFCNKKIIWINIIYFYIHN